MSSRKERKEDATKEEEESRERKKLCLLLHSFLLWSSFCASLRFLRLPSSSLVLFALEDDLAADDREQHLRLQHVVDRAAGHVSVDDDQVRQLALLQAPLGLLLVVQVGVVDRVQPQSLL